MKRHIAIAAEVTAATSERLSAAGVDHIVLADGRILVEGSRESSRLAVRKWRKSPEYKQYLALKEKYADKLGIKGGHSLRKQPNGKYKLVKLTPDEIKKLKKRAKAQKASPNLKGGERYVEPKKGKKGAKAEKPAPKKTAKVAPKKVAKPAPKKVAPKAAPKKAGKPVKKAGRSRD